ncbi:hypothetical protein [Micromonospora sp. CA-111912]
MQAADVLGEPVRRRTLELLAERERSAGASDEGRRLIAEETGS